VVVKAQNRFISNNAEREYNKHQVGELQTWLPQFLAIEQQRPVEEGPTKKCILTLISYIILVTHFS
jgi:hypothetical protein